MSPPTVRRLHYAFGGGLGHAVRTISLIRKLASRLPGPCRMLINTPFAAAVRRLLDAERLPVELAVLPADADPEQAGRFVRAQIAEFRPELLVVDAFPRGLGGEFAGAWFGALGRPRVLISRTLPAEYVKGYRLADFVRANYDLVVAPGEPGPFESALPTLRTEPFLLRDFAELPTPEAAAARLGTTADRPVVLLVGTGNAEECRRTADAFANLQRRWGTERPPLRLALPDDGPVPLLDVLPAVRLLIGSGGYNLFHEAAATATPALLVARTRRYDDQTARAGPRGLPDDPAGRLPVIDAALAAPRPAVPPYINGAVRGADAIAELMRKK